MVEKKNDEQKKNVSYGLALTLSPIMMRIFTKILAGISILLLTLAPRASAQEKIKVAVSNFSPSYMPMFFANKQWRWTLS